MGKLERITDKLLGRNSNRRASTGSREDQGRFYSPPGNQYAAADRLKRELLEEYRGKDLLSETEFELVNNNYGETLHLREPVQKPFTTPDTSPRDILSDLKLVYGIGSVREKELKQEGYSTIRELVNHNKWGDKAKSIQEVFQKESLTEAYRVLRRWKALSDSSFLKLSGLFDKEDFAIIDIETMGLSNQPVFLLGLAHPTGGGVAVHQFLAGDVSQEMATLAQFAGHLDDLGIILTYNGKNFDIPYIERRLAYYGKNRKFSHPHLDLYPFTRNRLSHKVRDCKLGTIERSILGVDRNLDVPSSLVPDFYNTYRESGNPGPLLPILAHNRQDLLSLIDLFHKLLEETINGDT